MTPIPACNPALRHQALWAEMAGKIHAVVAGGQLVLGPEVAAFEREFAHYLGVAHAIGVGNGTDALTLALLALDIGPGDEVIVPALTAAGSATAVCRCGATPVFADVDYTTRCLDPQTLPALLTPRTRAVIAVHLHGHAAPLAELSRLTRRHGLFLVEDAAQAHGLMLEGGKAGSFGDLAAFSFYPTKNLGALGDGGAVITNSAEHAARVRSLRCYGWDAARISQSPGMNSRLDEVQAAVLRVLLPLLDDYNDRRRRIAMQYCSVLKDKDLALPAYSAGSNWHQFAVAVPQREAFRDALTQQGIATDIHYPVGLQRMPAFPNGALPVTDRLAGELVSLPIQPEVVEPHLDRILDVLQRLS